MTPPVNRREFLQATAATAALAALPGSALAAPRASLPKSPTDLVTLGKTGIKVSLIGMGTGSHGSGQASNQTKLGIPGFTKLVRHALDRGVTLFDVADQYGSHVYLREALKGVPREKYVIQTKTHATDFATAKSHLERYRMELGVDMIDICLLHCMTKGGWQHDHTGSMDYLRQAKAEGLIRAHGTSCHGLDPLQTSAKENFVEIDLARINPEGLIMDENKKKVIVVDEVVSQLQEMHDSGKGVVGMKILAEGAFKEPARRDASLRYVLGLGTVDSFIIGFESTAQVDDLITRTADAIASLGGKRA